MNVGAWTGVLPSYLKNTHLIPDSVTGEKEYDKGTLGDGQPYAELPTNAEAISESIDAEDQMAAQDIASFQVVMSRDGKIIGFQPTSRVAVNHWASNPLAQSLYGGRKLSPGLLEPKLDIPLPSGVILLELLMSTDPKSSFALARPI